MTQQIKRFDSTEGNVWKYVFDFGDAITEAILYRYHSFEERTVLHNRPYLWYWGPTHNAYAMLKPYVQPVVEDEPVITPPLFDIETTPPQEDIMITTATPRGSVEQTQQIYLDDKGNKFVKTGFCRQVHTGEYFITHKRGGFDKEEVRRWEPLSISDNNYDIIVPYTERANFAIKAAFEGYGALNGISSADLKAVKQRYEDMSSTLVPIAAHHLVELIGAVRNGRKKEKAIRKALARLEA